MFKESEIKVKVKKNRGILVDSVNYNEIVADKYCEYEKVIKKNYKDLIIAKYDSKNYSNEEFETIINSAYENKRILIFENCSFTGDVKCPRLEMIIFESCEFNKFHFYFDEYLGRSVDGIWILNPSLIRDFRISGYNSNIYIKLTKNDSASTQEGVQDYCYEIELLNCKDSNLVIAGESKVGTKLAVKDSPFIILNVLVNIKEVYIDDVSCKFREFHIQNKFDDEHQLRSVRGVLGKYYTYLKDINSEERFQVYSIIKFIDRYDENKNKRAFFNVIAFITGDFIDPLRIFFIATCIVLISCIFYLYLGFNIGSGEDVVYVNYRLALNWGLSLEDFGQALYLSLITFSTVGYGNIVPSGWSELVASFEMIVGVVFIGIFTGSIFNRYVN